MPNKPAAPHASKAANKKPREWKFKVQEDVDQRNTPKNLTDKGEADPRKQPRRGAKRS
jgi:hypothetical protein